MRAMKVAVKVAATSRSVRIFLRRLCRAGVETLWIDRSAQHLHSTTCPSGEYH